MPGRPDDPRHDTVRPRCCRRPAAWAMQRCAICPSRSAGRRKSRHVTPTHAQAQSPPRHRSTWRASSPSTHRRRQRPVGGDPTVAARLPDRRQCRGSVPRWSPVHDALGPGGVPEGTSICRVEVAALSGRPSLVDRDPGEEVRPEQAAGAKRQQAEGRPDPLSFSGPRRRPENGAARYPGWDGAPQPGVESR
jgi:hypothetical protein